MNGTCAVDSQYKKGKDVLSIEDAKIYRSTERVSAGNVILGATAMNTPSPHRLIPRGLGTPRPRRARREEKKKKEMNR
jgi:hypothetical protein